MDPGTRSGGADIETDNSTFSIIHVHAHVAEGCNLPLNRRAANPTSPAIRLLVDRYPVQNSHSLANKLLVLKCH